MGDRAIPIKMDATTKIGVEGDAMFTLRSREGGGGINDVVLTPWDVQSKRVNLPSGNGSQGGCGYNGDGSAYTPNGRDRQSVAFVQNTRDEVRLFGGDGQTVGALAAQPGMKQTSYVMSQYGDIAGTLRARANSSPNVDGGQNVVCFNGGNANDVASIGEAQRETAPSLRASRSGTNGTPVVCMESAQERAAIEVGYSPTMNASHEQPIICAAGNFGGQVNDGAAYPDGRECVVRRLMPVECERLQAFPDGWTDITGCDVDGVAERVASALGYEDGGKEWKALRKKVEKWSEGTPDTPRYKAMGNSMTTYVIEILGRRIQAYDELHYDEVAHG